MRKSNKQTKQTMKMAAPGTSTQSWKAIIGSAVTTVATSTPYLAAATTAVLAGVVGASKYSEQNALTTVAATSVAAAALMAITYMVAGGGSMLIVGGISALAVAAVAGYEYYDDLQGALYGSAKGSSAECSTKVGKEGPAAGRSARVHASPENATSPENAPAQAPGTGPQGSTTPSVV